MATVPSSLQPTGVAQRQPTVNQQRKIRQYGSLEAYEAVKSAESKIKSELETSGIKNAGSPEEYSAKYAALSEQAKQFVISPSEYTQSYEKQKQKLVETNKQKIAKEIQKYQEKLKDKLADYDRRIDNWKERGDKERAQRYKDRRDADREYYKGLIAGLKEGIGQPIRYQDVISYAKQLAQYEKEKEIYQKAYRRAKEKDMEPSVEMTTSKPDIVSYTDTGKTQVVTPGQPLYYDIDEVTVKPSGEVVAKDGAMIYTSPEKTGAKMPAKKLKDLDKPEKEFSTISRLTPEFEISEQVRLSAKDVGVDVSKIDSRDQYDYGQGTMITNAPGIPSEAAQFVRRLERERELEELKGQGEYKESSVFTYNYGQASPITQTPETFSILKGVEPPTTRQVNVVVEEKRILPRTAEEKERTLERIREIEEDFAVGQRPPRPLLTEISAAGDTRGFLGTVFNIGPKPELTGSQVTLGTKAVLSEVQQEVYERELRNNMKSVYRQAEEATDLKKFQARVDAGENYDEVIEEYNQAVRDANKMIAEQREKFDKQYSERIGKQLESSAQQIFFDTQLIAQQKDQEAKIGGYFAKGAAVGGVAGAVGIGVGVAGVVAAPVLVPAVAGLGLVAGGLYTGYQYGKAIVEGEKVSSAASAIGFSPREARLRGLVGAGQSITPYAYTAAGALTGGLIVGGGLRYARKPIVTRVKVGTGRATVKAEGIISRKGVLSTGQKVVKGIPHKFGEVSEYGSRAEVTTPFRRFFGTRPLYTGSPNDTRGYIRAFTRLRQYGITEAKATAALKYQAPRFREQFLVSSTTSQLPGKKGVSRGVFEIKEVYKKIPVPSERNIYTRSGPTIKTKVIADTKIVDAKEIGRQYSVFSKTQYQAPKDAKGFFQIIRSEKTLVYRGGREVTFDQPTQTIYGVSTRTYDPIGRYTRVRSAPLYGTSTAGDQRIIYGPSDVSSNYVFDADLSGGDFLLGTGTSTRGPVIYVGGGAAGTKTFAPLGARFYSREQATLQESPEVGFSDEVLFKPVVTPVSSTQTLLSPDVKIDDFTYQSILLAPTALSFVGGAAVAFTYPDTRIQPRELDRFVIGQGVDVRQIQDQSSQLERQEVVVIEEGGITEVVDVVPPEPPPEPPPAGDPINFIVPPTYFPGRRRPVKTGPVPLYEGYVMVGNRYKKIDEPPAPKSKVLDIITNIIDNTVSAQGKVVPTGKKRVPTAKDRSDDYYNRNRRKFREFKIVNGKRVKLKNKVIERRGYRSDTPGEKAGLTLAQNVARRAKRAAGVPTRKSTKRRAPFRL